MTKKRVINLYRVSPKKQVDRIKQSDGGEDKFDIPMQKQACHEFIGTRPDWEFYRELSELGVSGYKVSAKERDAVQEIQQEALDGKFDVLLMFMFDRLGRIDDETPFIVEWFVKHGIEVWSVKEGEQRFEHHVDKLTNYIRFWQAAGESEKTSIRTKERLSQIVQEGRFRGGVAPFGYRLVKRGKVNKRGHEVYDIEVDEPEAVIVRSIFDLYLTKGYGSQRISTYLTEHGTVKAEAAEQRVRECEEDLHDSEQTKADLAGQFVNIQNWAELYETCDMATRKMIVSHLFKEIRVKEGYQVDIDLTASCAQLGLLADDIAGDEALEAKSA